MQHSFISPNLMRLNMKSIHIVFTGIFLFASKKRNMWIHLYKYFPHIFEFSNAHYILTIINWWYSSLQKLKLRPACQVDHLLQCWFSSHGYFELFEVAENMWSRMTYFLICDFYLLLTVDLCLHIWEYWISSAGDFTPLLAEHCGACSC